MKKNKTDRPFLVATRTRRAVLAVARYRNLAMTSADDFVRRLEASCPEIVMEPGDGSIPVYVSIVPVEKPNDPTRRKAKRG